MNPLMSLSTTAAGRISNPGIRIFFTLLCLLTFHQPGWSADSPAPRIGLGDVVVTGSRLPATLSGTGRSVTVISREDIEALPATGIADLLETVSGVDVRQRGGFGAQADVSIRGGSFEQTLILIDGLNVSDPQTGHHNMNLPVNLDDIDRIEILKGPAARSYGHNAMAGVINIITRIPDKDRAAAGAHYGGYDYVQFDGRVEGRIGGTSNRMSVSRRASSGHIREEETDFNTQTLNYKGTLKNSAHVFSLGLAYMESDFGAYKFYSNAYPNQRENTRTLLACGNAELRLKGLDLSPKVFWRQHKDVFDIEIGDRWFNNSHRTNHFGIALHSRFLSPWGETAFGGEAAGEDINSSNLGDHDRRRYGLFLEQRIVFHRKMSLTAGLSATRYSDWGWEYWPGAEVNIAPLKAMNCFVSAARSFRVPTYTELYYQTPANQGNPTLFPESAWTYDVGMRWTKNGWGAYASAFHRDSQNLIDWTRTPGEAVWKVRNISENTTRGLEVGAELYPGLFFGRMHSTTMLLSYAYLNSKRDTSGAVSKYALDHLRHQVNGALRIDWPNRLTQMISIRYARRIHQDSHLVADVRMTYSAQRWEVFCDITNIFDENYVDSGFAPAPGRWIVAGVRIKQDL